jgi:probable HAF family extracellular repeat protein
MRRLLDSRRARRLRRPVSFLGVALASGLGALALLPAGAQATSTTPSAPKFVFQTLDNPADLTFNQLLGINTKGVIAGYFGSGATGHPNKGYLLEPPYLSSDYVNENFPGSVQTQVTGLNNLGDTCGFWISGNNTNRGFVEWNGVFASYTDPNTPKGAGSVNQLLGINDAGIAVGFYNDAKGNSHAYTVNQATGKFTAINIPDAVSTTATGINNAGGVVGFFTDSAGQTASFLLVGSSLTTYQFPSGSDTQALGINDSDQIVGSYLDSKGVMHGFELSKPLGPKSTWLTVDDPHGIGSTVVNGINDAGDLVGFYTDSAGNTDGMLATPAVTVVKRLTLVSMPYGSATFSRGSSGDLTVTPDMAGLTPGSAHAVQLVLPGSSSPVSFSTLAANSVGQADATLDSSYTGGIPSGSVLIIRNGTTTSHVASEPIAQTAALSGVPSSAVKLTAVEVSSTGVSFGTPKGTATITYNPDAQSLTVVVNASGLTPGTHAAHVHIGSCQSQGPVFYMLMDFVANSHGQVVNESRTVSDVTTPIPPSGWYLNLHQGNHSNILTSSGTPTILFRPLLCSDIS